jgi:aldose 1-epimerase
MIATGTLMKVDNSALDFRRAKPLNAAVTSGNEMIRTAGGIDFCYVLDGSAINATASSSQSDLSMSLHTTCPGLQLYTGQNLVSPYRRFAGFCMEPQYFPDSPNHDEFPGTVVRPGVPFRAITRYRFVERALSKS